MPSRKQLWDGFFLVIIFNLQLSLLRPNLNNSNIFVVYKTHELISGY